MDKTKLLFMCNSTDETTLELISNHKDEICLSVDMDEVRFGYIYLNKATAIRLVRELKKQIGTLNNLTNE